MIKAIIGKIIGTRNDRWIKQYKKQVLAINALEPTYEKMSDDELQNAFEELKNECDPQKKICKKNPFRSPA